MAKQLRPDTGDNCSLPCVSCGISTPDSQYCCGLPWCDNCREQQHQCDPRDEIFEEWRVTGDPGEGYPKYDFVYSPDRNPHLGDPEQMARKFMAMLAERTPPWLDGPHLSKRVVRRTQWEEVER